MRRLNQFLSPRFHAAGGLIVALTSTIIIAGSSPAQAQRQSDRGLDGVGPFFGIGINPEQVLFGIRWGMGELSNRLDLRAGVEGGAGDHHIRGAFQIDALYRFRERWDVWQPYAGGGLSAAVINHDHHHDDDDDDHDDTEFEPGLNLIGGVSKGVRGDDLFQAEVRIGIGEAPDLSISLGWLFR